MKSHEFGNRGLFKPYSSSPTKKTKETINKFPKPSRFLRRDRFKQSFVRTPTTLVSSTGSVQNIERAKCNQCGCYHPGVCRLNERTCFNCGSTEFNRDQNEKSIMNLARGRRPRNISSTGIIKDRNKDGMVRSKTRALARTYAIHAREEALAPEVIASIFSLFDVNVYAFIDPRLTHSYTCDTLAFEKNFPIESTDCVVKVTNPLDHSVIVDLVGRQCPLKIQNHDFPTDLILLPFNEFDIILGMLWLNVHDVVVNF